jgi:uncharacterized protein YkwD
METRSPRRAVRTTVLALTAVTLIGPTTAGRALAADEPAEWPRFEVTPDAYVAVRPSGSGNKAEEGKLRTYINEARDKRGARRLDRRGFLVRAARRHSRWMADTEQRVHRSDLASYVGNRDWNVIGENIGYGPSMEVLHDAFMASPPHRRNALDRRYKNVGVGMALGDDGRIWVTVLFLG